MVSWPKLLASLPLPRLSHAEVNFPSAMTQGSETTFSKLGDYLFIISCLIQSSFLAAVPSRPQIPTEETGSPLWRLPWEQMLSALWRPYNVIIPPPPEFPKTSEWIGESEHPCCCPDPGPFCISLVEYTSLSYMSVNHLRDSKKPHLKKGWEPCLLSVACRPEARAPPRSLLEM